MSELRIQFENAFPVPAHWIEFDEKRNKYYCPYVADAKAHGYQAQWEVWQSRQSEIDQLKAEKAGLVAAITGIREEMKEARDNFVNVKAQCADMSDRNWWQSKIQLLSPYLRKLDKALRGGHE